MTFDELKQRYEAAIAVVRTDLLKFEQEAQLLQPSDEKGHEAKGHALALIEEIRTELGKPFSVKNSAIRLKTLAGRVMILGQIFRNLRVGTRIPDA